MRTAESGGFMFGYVVMNKPEIKFKILICTVLSTADSAGNFGNGTESRDRSR